MSTEYKRTLYLFVDTNLFIQCLPLEELDWSAWKDFEEVQLVVCRPVQREIDNQKNQGNNRVAIRARSTFKVFRQIIASREELRTIRDVCPLVTLRLEGPSLPSSELKDRLDYSKPDDEIIGCLHRFRQDNPNEDARLLTHDGGPMMTAKSLNLPFIPISDSWLLPPENNEVEKENARLKLEIDQLRKLEPEFIIKLCDESGHAIETIEVEYRVYEPLNDQDINELVALLEQRFPMVSNFISSQKFIGPPSYEKRERYKKRHYPEWITACERILSNLHDALERRLGRPSILISVENRGTRPARDALIEFNALGKFNISPPLDDFPDWYLEQEDIQIDLPSPPKPPKGKLLGETLFGVNRILDYPKIITPFRVPPAAPIHEPNGLYYKQTFPLEPVDSICLSCDQWRHDSSEVELGVEICMDSDTSQVKGSIECVVQAENISSPVRKRFSMTMNVVKIDTKVYAYKMIQGLRRIRP